MRISRDQAVAALLVLALGLWGGLWVRAWDTWVAMNHATGTVAALADAAVHGEAAGHERESEYLGALYAPPFPLLVAALYRMGLSWLHALRVASLLSALTFLAAVAWAVRAAGASPAGTRVALALLVACGLFKLASLGGRADLLAASLTAGAVGAWLRDRELRGWACASLAAAAWLCKVSELATPLAVVGYGLFTRGRRPTLRFLVRFAIACAVGVALLLPFHGLEWYAQAFSTTLFSPPNLSSWLRGPAEALRYAGSFAELAVIAALAIAALADPAMRGSPLRWSTGAALLLALLVLANRGADHNHLLTALALAGVCAGAAWGSPGGRLALTAVLLVVPAASWRDTASLARQIASPSERRAAVIAAVRAEPGPVLAEDPLVLLAAGRRSPITDPSTLRSRALAGDPRAQAIARATGEGRWSLVVLEHDADQSLAWYRDFHFGDEFMTALRARYARAAAEDDYVLYRRLAPAPAR